MTKYAIIVAGGKGTRFGSEMPKQFLPLKGTPVLMHTINRFANHFDNIIVVLPEEQIEVWKKLCDKHNFITTHKIVAGGATRFHSVKNAIDSITPNDNDIIAVHDGVRPLVNSDIITNTIEASCSHGSGIPVIDVTDTIRQVANDDISQALLRSSLRAVQTPQTFNAKILKSSYDTPFNKAFTDDASVVEASGHHITLTEGNPRNIKITHSIDLIIAEELLKNE